MVSVTRAVFGDLPLGAGTVEKFQLQSDQLRVDIISWGCTITALEVKDRQGRASDVVLGFDELEGGLNSAPGLPTGPRPAAHTAPHQQPGMRGPRGSTELVTAWIRLTQCVVIQCLGKDKVNRNCVELSFRLYIQALP